jgi:6-phosphofructokinase 1
VIVVTENQFDVHQLAEEITLKSGFDARATVLGYLQRGGHPVAYDRILASRLGHYAVELLKQDIHGVCVGVKNNQLISTSLSAAKKDEELNEELYNLAKVIR